MKPTPLAYLSLTILVLCSTSRAAEPVPKLTLPNGQIFEEVLLQGAEKDKVRLKHKRGESLVPLENIDDAAAKALGVFDPNSEFARTAKDRFVFAWIRIAKFIQSEVPVRKPQESAKDFRGRIDKFIKRADTDIGEMRKQLLTEEAEFDRSKKEGLLTPQLETRMENLHSLMFYCELVRVRAIAEAKKAR